MLREAAPAGQAGATLHSGETLPDVANGKRLTSKGVGPLAPVAPNTSEDGRAKNRRVELVAE
jgi:flagellar motor protein MotB